MDVKFVRYTRDVKGELSITANGTYDVTKYASANVNVQSAPVLLWTNASPTSNFQNGQTLTFSGEYTGYIVEARGSTGNSKIGKAFFLVGDTWGAVGIEASGSGMPGNTTFRHIKSATKNSITFGYGGFNNSMSDGFGIPTRIWGVKFTL